MDSRLNLNNNDSEYEVFLRKIGIKPIVLPQRHLIESDFKANKQLPNEIYNFNRQKAKLSFEQPIKKVVGLEQGGFSPKTALIGQFAPNKINATKILEAQLQNIPETQNQQRIQQLKKQQLQQIANLIQYDSESEDYQQDQIKQEQIKDNLNQQNLIQVDQNIKEIFESQQKQEQEQEIIINLSQQQSYQLNEQPLEQLQCQQIQQEIEQIQQHNSQYDNQLIDRQNDQIDIEKEDEIEIDIQDQEQIHLDIISVKEIQPVVQEIPVPALERTVEDPYSEYITQLIERITNKLIRFDIIQESQQEIKEQHGKQEILQQESVQDISELQMNEEKYNKEQDQDINEFNIQKEEEQKNIIDNHQSEKIIIEEEEVNNPESNDHNNHKSYGDAESNMNSQQTLFHKEKEFRTLNQDFKSIFQQKRELVSTQQQTDPPKQKKILSSCSKQISKAYNNLTTSINRLNNIFEQYIDVIQNQSESSDQSLQNEQSLSNIVQFEESQQNILMRKGSFLKKRMERKLRVLKLAKNSVPKYTVSQSKVDWNQLHFMRSRMQRRLRILKSARK